MFFLTGIYDKVFNVISAAMTHYWLYNIVQTT